MKNHSLIAGIPNLLLLALLSTLAYPLSTSGQGTAFTYQGRLNVSAQPANGLYDLRFRLATDAVGSNYVATTLLLNNQGITNGLFTAALDFGAGTFTGANLWLQVDVRTNGGGGYTALNPLQPLTPAPYAMMAANATLATSALTAGTASSIFASNIVGLVSLTQLPGSVLTNNESNPVSLNSSLVLPAPATVYSGAALLLRSDPANRNFFAGGAGNLTLSGIFNTADGYSSMKNMTTGSSNTASGSYTLFQNTAGSNNTAGGSYALFSNTSGGDNTANGYYAMSYNTDGGFNTALGRTALLYNTDGNYNTALGACALYYITNGGFNTAIGESALANLKSGVGNIGIGYYAGAHLTNGHDNIYIGDSFNTAPGNPNETNVMRLGTTQTQTFIAGVINGNGGGLTNVPINLPPSVLTNNASAVTLSGSFTGNGAGLTNLDATTLDGSNSASFWQIGGNTGTTAGVNFLGTMDNQPLELKANGTRALRLEPGLFGLPNVIGGSLNNFVTPGRVGATIGGGGSPGSANTVTANFGTIGGGLGNNCGGTCTVGGGNNNTSSAMEGATVAGGNGNTSSANQATVGGGGGNTSSAPGATVGGGSGNRSGGDYATVGGGYSNTNTGRYAAVGGGLQNTISGFYATVGGGLQNTDSGDYGAVSGGYANLSSGFCATVAGGFSNTAGGQYSFAAGRQAKALYPGSFVWADAVPVDFSSTSANQFLIRASGGVGIGTPSPVGDLHLYSSHNPTSFRIQSTGTPGFGRVEFVSNPQGDPSEWRPGFIQSTDNGGFTGGLAFYVNGSGFANAFSTNEVMRIVNGRVGIGTTNPTNNLHVVGGVSATAFVLTSDRNAKENFAAISPKEVLAKVAALPITEWNFKDMPGLRHMGPMAQDFYAAFGLGGSDTTITSVDPDGVALAAIQGLDQIVKDQKTELEGKARKIASLEDRLARLEKIVNRWARPPGQE